MERAARDTPLEKSRSSRASALFRSKWPGYSCSLRATHKGGWKIHTRTLRSCSHSLQLSAQGDPAHP